MGLDTVELVWEVEDAFSVEISDPEAAGIRTTGELHALVLRKRGIAAGSPEALQAWERVCDLIVEISGVKRERIVPEARIVADLGLQ